MEIHVWPGRLRVEARDRSGWGGLQRRVGGAGVGYGGVKVSNFNLAVSRGGVGLDGAVVALSGVTGDIVCRWACRQVQRVANGLNR